MKERILNIIKSSNGDFISGQYISDTLGVTRTAIWKYINILKDEGYVINSVPKKGYKLLSSPDLLSYEEIKTFLNTKYIGRNLKHFYSIDSTNLEAKRLAQSGIKEAVVISEEQTNGRGRLGRNWCSPKYKGIWMSLILSPSISPMEVTKITQIAAASVYCALKDMLIDSYIKWPNDIIINNKKVCGILTEMSCELNKIDYVTVGIGLNVNIDKYDFPKDILDMATSLSIETSQIINRKKLAALILNNFELLYDDFLNNNSISKTISICKKNSLLLGKQIRIINKNNITLAKALDLDSEGRLIVQYQDGKEDIILSGEVSIRGLYGYV
ncbi:biotin--[acetyl-CoA-carboxylase] ligase [Clostridium rectalis]|uniref:biotin--[acetyl-CoA-carboxylase] ligase n=1 Tax=Clostridium rectalis TaxID=2040295 RepID=UPI000F63C558|nr:biotin--[acetyl-CoA-carboxylase] ligase [Clostridium rectalis]